jgi:hypothetical protein
LWLAAAQAARLVHLAQAAAVLVVIAQDHPLLCQHLLQ